LGCAPALLEHKRTDKKSMILERAWLDKVRAGARRLAKEPALGITFEQKLRPPEDWVLIPLDVYQRLTQGGSDVEPRRRRNCKS
jgi:hypothetical protein